MSQVDSENSTAVPSETPAEPAGELSSPKEAFHEIWCLREEARREIDRLVNFLDETDNHMELEPEEDDDLEDEPSLGSLDRAMNQTRWKGGTFFLREEFDCELDYADDEPTLAAPENHPSSGSGGNQQRWAAGSADDREGGDDDREEDRSDLEPSLGWTESHQGMVGGCEHRVDYELAGSTVTDEARQRYRGIS